MIKPEIVEKALTEVRKRAANYEYFFEHLESPSWIEPLLVSGFFKVPPEPVRDSVRHTIGFPFWPESRYLARMARFSDAQEQVLRIALAIPDTDNTRVHEDLAEIALNLPTKLAAEFVTKAIRWIESPYHLLLPMKLAALTVYLAGGQEGNAALTLARALFAVLPDPRMADGEDRDALGRSSPGPRSRFDPVYYEHLLKKCLPPLAEAVGEEAFRLFCHLLESATELSMHPGEDPAPEDYSYVWRPAIEEHGPSHRGEIKNALASAVRDSVQQLARDDPGRVPLLVKELESRPWEIFRRIALYLLWRFPEAGPCLVAERLTDRMLFDDLGIRHEYYMLSQKCFANLSSDKQQLILNWVEEGPRDQGLDEGELDRKGVEEFSLAELYRKRWQRDRLAALHDSLPEEWARRYEGLIAEVGPPRRPDLVFFTEFFAGPIGPVSATELRDMPVEDLLKYLAVWIQPRDPIGPSREGLGRDLMAVFASNPEPYANAALSFQNLHPTYLHALLWGLRDALRARRQFPWGPVLGLSAWAIQQTSGPDESESDDDDADWRQVRREIGALMDAGLEAGDTELAWELRSDVWTIVRALTDDPDPTPEREARYADSNADAASLWINTVRGQAVYTVVRYALWVRRRLEMAPDAQSRLARGFDEMPEVREVLERHLDTASDPSLAVRAVYGNWFPWLVLLDRGWAESNADRVFPTGQEKSAYWDAAWETYMSFCEAFDSVFDILRPHYRHAIAQIGKAVRRPGRLADVDERLAEHLMTLYWRGILSLEEPEGHLADFYSKANPSLRAHAIQFVGRSLGDTPAEVSAAILERLESLWISRLAAAKPSDRHEEIGRELAAFGWWFSSGKFPDDWALHQLNAVLDRVGSVDPDHLVVERLAALAPTHTLDAVHCLEAIVRGDRDGWGVHRWSDDAKSILRAAIASANAEAREAAIDLVHRLGALGHFDFRELLPAESHQG